MYSAIGQSPRYERWMLALGGNSASKQWNGLSVCDKGLAMKLHIFWKLGEKSIEPTATLGEVDSSWHSVCWPPPQSFGLVPRAFHWVAEPEIYIELVPTQVVNITFLVEGYNPLVDTRPIIYCKGNCIWWQLLWESPRLHGEIMQD